ncbi:MAG TPA: zinc ribbon domain-containing protein [Puia sp.]|nr:zinc ribbon domain-containing protein [Puia sp.]
MQSLSESAQQYPAGPASLTSVTSHSGPATLHCGVCGAPMYATDKGNHEITYHCSSPEARFWDYDRGSALQHSAKKHWDESIREIFLNRG